MRFLSTLLTFMVVLAAAGCGPESPWDEPARAPMLRAERPTEPIEVEELRIDLQRGQEVGEYRWTLWRCDDSDDRVLWHSTKALKRVSDDWIRLAERTLGDNGYPLSADPDNLFANVSQYSRDATYQIGARVVDVQMDICDHIEWLSNDRQNLQSGKAWIQVEWSVFSVPQKRVIFSKTLTGQGVLESGRRDGVLKLLDNAFIDSARRLAADEEFYAVMTQPRPHPDEVRTTWISLHIRKRPLFTTPVAGRSESIRRSVVFIGTRATGHGSGFFITPRLILTNAHVVDGNDRVQITLLSGRKITGEVLRIHPARDVALVRVAEAGYQPLPIRESMAEIGETVFAVGSPYFRELESTVSRGSVSAYRQNSRDLRDIQADVDIHPGNSGGPLLDRHGNVVGLTYAGYSDKPARSSIGLNLFIPIKDALRKLRVRLGLPDSDRTKDRGIVMP